MTSAGTTAESWWRAPFRLLQTNLRETDATLDAVEEVERLIRLGFDTWLCNAGGIAYFYPVTGEFQREASTLHRRPSGDLVGDVLAAARARDVRVLSRFDFSRLPSEIVAAHPDWAFVGADGTWFVEDGLTGICPRSEYHDRLVPEVLEDFVTRYPVDGVFFNWLQYTEIAYSGAYLGPCRCDRCTAAFATAHPGVPHPRTPADPGYTAWVQLAQERLTALAERYSAVVNAVRPGTPLMLADVRMDIAFLETNSALGHSGATWWRHTPSEIASANRISDPGVPALVHSSVNMGLPFRQVAEEPTHFRRYVAQALSRGALPSVVAVGTVDEGRSPCIAAAAPLLGFLRDHDDLYRAYRTAARVAVVRPRGGTALSAMQSRDSFAEFRGWYAALQEAHVPFDVLGLQFQERIVADDVLSRYDVIVVPGATGAGPAFCAAVDRFVESGGSVVFSGDAFTGDEPAFATHPGRVRRAALRGLAELGGRYLGPVDGRTDRTLLPVVGGFDLVDWAPDVERAPLALSTQSPFGPPELTGGNIVDPEAVALVRADRGAGRVVVLPWTAGETAYTSGLTALDALLVAEVRALLGADVTAEISSEIELTAGAADDALVLHLVNHSGGRGDRVRAPLPIGGSLVLPAGVADTATRARALVRGDELALRRDDDGTVRIEVLVDDVLEVVVVD